MTATPPRVYDAIAGYVSDRWRLDRELFIRPFYPGGDFENAGYPPGCCVVDNPPFSILSQIVRFYLERSIPFFLFAPHLTLLGLLRHDVNLIACKCDITYDNGAVVPTSFVTSLPAPALSNAPELSRMVDLAQGKGIAKEMPPRRVYPDELLMVTMLDKLTMNGVEFQLERSEFQRVPTLDCMPKTKGLFGSGLLLGHDAARRLQAARAEVARAEVHIPLSDRERAIVDGLG